MATTISFQEIIDEMAEENSSQFVDCSSDDRLCVVIKKIFDLGENTIKIFFAMPNWIFGRKEIVDSAMGFLEKGGRIQIVALESSIGKNNKINKFLEMIERRKNELSEEDIERLEVRVGSIGSYFIVCDERMLMLLFKDDKNMTFNFNRPDVVKKLEDAYDLFWEESKSS